MKYLYTLYTLRFPKVLLYMLQNTDYRFAPYIKWLRRTSNFNAVMKRRTLEMTRKVSLLLFVLQAIRIVILLGIGFALFKVIFGEDYLWLVVAFSLILAAPFLLAYGILVPLFIGWLFIQKPREFAIISRAKKILSTHPGRRIAIAGSFGKTTAKEILLTVLGEGVKVAATPGNMNTAIGISRFATTLDGDEDVLIFELGEEKVGDVRKLSKIARPDTAVITGINEAHLDSFKSLDATVSTIFEITEFVEDAKLYVNDESELVHINARPAQIAFNRKSVSGWKISNASTSVKGTEFDITRKDITIHAHTALIGLHTIGVTAACIVIAHELGLTKAQIEKGLKDVQPFEHRMQPRLLHGAHIIDDTYNGNSEGVKAGLQFLKTVEAKRRIYVTPGLVEQGNKKQSVHEMIGEQLASSADVVVLMNNSVTDFIKDGLMRKKFKGSLIIVDDPLEFYTNLDQFVATGDVVLMQNDWTDNYQ